MKTIIAMIVIGVSLAAWRRPPGAGGGGGAGNWELVAGGNWELV